MLYYNFKGTVWETIILDVVGKMKKRQKMIWTTPVRLPPLS